MADIHLATRLPVCIWTKANWDTEQKVAIIQKQFVQKHHVDYWNAERENTHAKIRKANKKVRE